MNGPRMGHLDPPFVDCHPPHIDSFFVQFSRDGNTHMSSVLVFDSYQQMNAFGPYIYSVNFYPSNEWMVPTLILGSIVIQKTNFHVTPNKFRVSQFVCFICPNGIKWGPKRPCVTWSPKGPQKIKKAGKMRSLLHVGCFFNARWPMGVEKCMVWGWPSLVVSFGSSCGPYKAHETYAMFLH